MSQLEQVQSTDMIPRVDADAVPKPQIRLERRTPAYWRVTLDNPPFNIFGPKTIPELNAVITAIENDPMVKVVVFDSAVPGFFLTHYDFVPELAETTSLAPGPTGMHPLPDMLVRLSRATVRNIRMNLAISVVMKAAFVVAAIAGVATLWMAVVADTGASIIVIANALRLLRAD